MTVVGKIPVPEIRVRDDTGFTQTVFDGVTTLMFWGGFERSELPRDLLSLHEAYEYDGNVKNGGFGAFLGNRRPSAEQLGLCREGLCRVGDTELVAIFDDLRAFMTAHPDQAQMLAAGYGFEFPAEGIVTPDRVEELQKRFFAADRQDTFGRRVAALVRTAPSVRIVPDDRYGQEMADLIVANPKRLEWLEVQGDTRISGEGDASGNALEQAAFRTREFWKDLVAEAGFRFVRMTWQTQHLYFEGHWSREYHLETDHGRCVAFLTLPPPYGHPRPNDPWSFYCVLQTIPERRELFRRIFDHDPLPIGGPRRNETP